MSTSRHKKWIASFLPSQLAVVWKSMGFFTSDNFPQSANCGSWIAVDQYENGENIRPPSMTIFSLNKKIRATTGWIRLGGSLPILFLPLATRIRGRRCGFYAALTADRALGGGNRLVAGFTH